MMMKMEQPKMNRTCLWLLLQCWLFHFSVGSKSNTPCGGRLTVPMGVIHTPNFPGPFVVPIKCRWVIDASELPSSNGSIVVYLTQLYVYKGLTFTEYAYYESESSSLGATLIKEVTEGNVFEFRWFKTFRPFLVIDFSLDRLEGNHIRVLNNLLNVYGFNITYVMTGAEGSPDSCSVRDCSYAGNCIVGRDHSTFRCECFEGFKGPHCGDGPLCLDDQRSPVCLNGATCKHVGAEAVRCHCAAGFAGNNCGIRLPQNSGMDCEEGGCIMQCPFNSKNDQPCNCRNGTKILNDRSRFECRIKLSNVTSVRAGLSPHQGTIEVLLGKHIHVASILGQYRSHTFQQFFTCPPGIYSDELFC